MAVATAILAKSNLDREAMKKSYVAQNGSTWIVPHKKLSLDKTMFISISIQADYAIILQLLMPYN